MKGQHYLRFWHLTDTTIDCLECKVYDNIFYIYLSVVVGSMVYKFIHSFNESMVSRRLNFGCFIKNEEVGTNLGGPINLIGL